MYFWNANALARDLREGKVTQGQKFFYFLIFMAMSSLAMYAGVETDSSYLLMDMLSTVIVTVAGTYLCYQANARGDNKEFIDRFICIGFPIIVRFIPIVVFVMVVYYGVGMYAGFSYVDESSIIDILIATVLEITYFIWVRSYIAKIAAH